MSSAARIEELQKKFDENPRRYFAPLANECRKAGELDAAIAICRAHLPQQPGHMSGHIVYGQALFESGELVEAKSVFETALALDPENLIALRHMGDIAARGGDVADARQWYTRVLETDPRNEEIQALLAEMGGASVPEGAAGSSEGTMVEGLPELLDPELLAAAAEAEQPFTQPDAVPGGSEPEPLLIPTALGGDDRDVHAASGTLDGFEATSFEAPARDSAPGPPAAEPTAEPELLTFEMPALDTPQDRSPAADAAGFDTAGTGGTGLEAIADAFGGTTAGSAGESRFAAELPDSDLVDDRSTVDDAFVTETMAELYLSQGYHDRALEVYRQLVAQQPGDAALRARMEQVESARSAPSDDAMPQAASGAPVESETAAGLPSALDPALLAAAVEATDAAGPAAGRDDAGVATGPTIRDFLTALAHGRAFEQGGADPIAAEAPLHAFAEAPPALVDSIPEAAPLPDLDATPLPDMEVAPLPDAEPALPDLEVSGPGPGSHTEPPSWEVAEVVAVTEVSGPLGGIPLMEWDDVGGGSPGPVSAVDASAGTAVPGAASLGNASPGDASQRADDGGGLDGLFGAPTNATDIRAADVLRAAYAPASERADAPDPGAGEVNPLSGKPARPAANDLSLDSVFGGSRQAGAGRSGAGFSFDQFFSDGAVKAPREESQEPVAAEGDTEDLEQFNSWLHGLKNQ